MFSRIRIGKSTGSCSRRIEKLRTALEHSDAVVIGAGAGLSTSAGYAYSGERFRRFFADFEAKYGIRDMYSGGFYPFADPEELWAWWSRCIYCNRYVPWPKPVYEALRTLAEDRDYFVLTTNADHCFQRAGFDKKRLFYTQGDYGLWQCSGPCHEETYDNEAVVTAMMEAQGFVRDADGVFVPPEEGELLMRVPEGLVPRCPKCGRLMTMNLRCDDTFVEDAGWHRAAGRYDDFIRRHANLKVLYLELGVGGNTPGIIKYPFWQMTARNPDAVYACINLGEAYCPIEIEDRSVCIDADIGEVLCRLER